MIKPWFTMPSAGSCSILVDFSNEREPTTPQCTARHRKSVLRGLRCIDTCDSNRRPSLVYQSEQLKTTNIFSWLIVLCCGKLERSLSPRLTMSNVSSFHGHRARRDSSNEVATNAVTPQAYILRKAHNRLRQDVDTLKPNMNHHSYKTMVQQGVSFRSKKTPTFKTRVSSDFTIAPTHISSTMIY